MTFAFVQPTRILASSQIASTNTSTMRVPANGIAMTTPTPQASASCPRVQGASIGLLLLAPLAWSLRSMVVGVTPASPLMYVASAAAAIVIALTAAWLPARRAAQLDPMTALRYD